MQRDLAALQARQVTSQVEVVDDDRDTGSTVLLRVRGITPAGQENPP